MIEITKGELIIVLITVFVFGGMTPALLYIWIQLRRISKRMKELSDRISLPVGVDKK